MKGPKISIIVPYYNSEDFLERCIESILKQTFSDFELILVNDGSTDKSSQISQAFADLDSRVTLLQKENGGQGSARNLGLDHVRGNYIGFVDSDDFIEPQMYEILYEKIILNDADLAICGYNIFRKKNGTPKPFTKIRDVILFNNFSLMKTYLSESYISGGPCNKLYKKNLFDNLRFPILKMREDAYVMPYIIKNTTKAVFVGEDLYNWFLREGSTERSSFTMNNLSAMESINPLEEVVQNNYPSLFGYVEMERALTRVYLLSKIISSGFLKKYRELYIELLDELNTDFKRLEQYKYINPKQYKYIRFVAKKNNLFIIYEYVINKLKITIKRILY